MAKRVKLQQGLTDPDETTTTEGADQEHKEPTPAKKAATPAKKTASKSGSRNSTTTRTAKKTATSKAKKAPGKQPATKKAAAPATQPARRRTEPQVKGIKVTDAARVSLYLHPDDYDWIKYELRGGDIQAVLRSMIAVCRHSPRLTEQVAKLSRTAPRGEH